MIAPVKWAFTLAALAFAAEAAPIRVGIYKGLGGGTAYWHASIHPGSAAVAKMLANPAGAGLQNPPIPARGFSVTFYGADTSCAQAGCAATADQRAAFVAALDTLDVVVFPSNIDFSIGFPNGSERERLRSFWRTRGLLSLHQSNDAYAPWSGWDSLHGARYRGHPETERHATLRVERGEGRGLLNSGLPDSARFSDEWLFFQTSGPVIRSQPFLQVHVTLDENSMEGGLGEQTAMGDHPLVWSRQWPEGGRTVYSALGHKTSTFDSVYFFRRQLYNAILWASKDTTGNGSVGIKPTRDAGAPSRGRAKASGSRALEVTFPDDGNHSVGVYTLEGRQVGTRKGSGPSRYVFPGLERNAVYIVVLADLSGKSTKRIPLP